jgi:hypothetical protein
MDKLLLPHQYPSVLIDGLHKEQLCIDVLKCFENVPLRILVSSADTNPVYIDFFPNVQTYYPYDPDIVDRIFIRQSNLKCNQSDYCSDLMLFLDNWTSFGHDRMFKKLLNEHRLYKIILIVKSQLDLVPDEFRELFEVIL